MGIYRTKGVLHVVLPRACKSRNERLRFVVVTTPWREWSEGLTARVAGAVKARRVALGLTAAEVAEKTAVGKPLTRAVISDLETGRKKTLEVSELLTLAAALDIPPILLLFPDYPNGEEYLRVLPGEPNHSLGAAEWFSGVAPGPGFGVSSNPGVALVKEAARQRRRQRHLSVVIATTPATNAPPTRTAVIANLRADIETGEQQIAIDKAKVWGAGDA